MMVKVGLSQLSSSSPPSLSSSDTLFYSDQCLELGVAVARRRESQIGDQVSLESSTEAMPPRRKGKKKKAVTTGEII